MPSVCQWICATHRLPIAQERDLDGNGLEAPMFMKLTDALQRLMQQVEDAVPQPEHKSQMGARSVVQAMRASHGAAGSACKATGQAADLTRLTRTRRGLHREIVGAVQSQSRNLCPKRLNHLYRKCANDSHNEPVVYVLRSKHGRARGGIQ